MKRKYKRSTDAIFTEVGSDIVALHVERGQCFGMEKVAAAVWELLADPVSLDDICARLLAHYDVSPELCRQDVENLISQFVTEGLAEQVDGAH